MWAESTRSSFPRFLPVGGHFPHRSMLASDRPNPDLAVVIPVHNEQDNIAPLLDEVDAALKGIQETFELLVVDDGSSDDTAGVLRRERLGRPHLTVIRHRDNLGQSAALATGVRAARAAWVATLDGDGQNDPGDIPNLWKYVTSANRDPALRLIVGHRRKRHDPWLRRASSSVANGVRGRLLGDRTPDAGCGLKVFERETFLRLPLFDHFHRFLPSLMQRAGWVVASLEVSHRPRRAGVSHYGVRNRLWVGLVDLLGAAWLGRRSGPWAACGIDSEAGASADGEGRKNGR